MTMRNVDKIKRLEKEIGRYQKKVADQTKVEKRLRAALEEAHAGSIQANKAVDAILAQTAITYGEKVFDEETGAEIGRRLTVQMFDIEDVLGKYEVRARRDENADAYVIGVVQRDAEDSMAGKSSDQPADEQEWKCRMMRTFLGGR